MRHGRCVVELWGGQREGGKAAGEGGRAGHRGRAIAAGARTVAQSVPHTRAPADDRAVVEDRAGAVAAGGDLHRGPPHAERRRRPGDGANGTLSRGPAVAEDPVLVVAPAADPAANDEDDLFRPSSVREGATTPPDKFLTRAPFLPTAHNSTQRLTKSIHVLQRTN